MFPTSQDKLNEEHLNEYEKAHTRIKRGYRLSYAALGLIVLGFAAQRCDTASMRSGLESLIYENKSAVQQQNKQLRSIREDGFFVIDPCYEQTDNNAYDVTPCYNQKTE